MRCRSGSSSGSPSAAELAGLADIKFRWGMLAVAGFALQIILFSEPVSERIGDAGPPVYVASTALVLVAVHRATSGSRAWPWSSIGAASQSRRDRRQRRLHAGEPLTPRRSAGRIVGYSNTP